MPFQLSLALHIVGAVLWIGGLMVTAGLLRYYETTEGAKSGPSYQALTRRYFYAMVIPGVVISAVSGTVQVLMMGVPFYLAQGWFHSKLTCVLALLIVTFAIGGAVSKVQRGVAVKGKIFGMLHGVIGMLFLAILIVTYLGRVTTN